MNKFLLICFCIFTSLSCSQNNLANSRIKPETFIVKPGKYFLGSKQIWLKKFTDGTLVFAIGDDLNRKVLYQQNMFTAFSDNHKWLLYVDDKENIWLYNGDLQIYNVLVYDMVNHDYKVRDYKKDNLEIPTAFKTKLQE